jgi:hypothetical protein
MPLPEGLKNLLSKQGVPGWVITGLALGVFCWTIASNLSTGAFILNLLSWLSDPTHAPTISMWADRLAKWGPIPLFFVGLAWLFYVATHPKAKKPATGHDNQTTDRIEGGPRNDLTLEEMRAQVAAADAELAEVEDREWQQQRERERPELERFREIYPQVERAVAYATEYVVADLLLAPTQGNEANMLIFNLLRVWAVAPCQSAGERLALDLVAPDVAPLDTIMADLKDLLTKYGLLVAYIERAGRIVLGPRKFYESEGYAGLWQRHRECIAELRKISLRSTFRSIASHLAPLADLLASQPLTPAEVARRHVIMVDLRKLYMSTRPDVAPEIAAGTAWPPTDWMNAKLEQAGELWRL